MVYVNIEYEVFLSFLFIRCSRHSRIQIIATVQLTDTPKPICFEIVKNKNTLNDQIISDLNVCTITHSNMFDLWRRKKRCVYPSNRTTNDNNPIWIVHKVINFCGKENITQTVQYFIKYTFINMLILNKRIPNNVTTAQYTTQ